MFLSLSSGGSSKAPEIQPGARDQIQSDAGKPTTGNSSPVDAVTSPGAQCRSSPCLVKVVGYFLCAFTIAKKSTTTPQSITSLTQLTFTLSPASVDFYRAMPCTARYRTAGAVVPFSVCRHIVGYQHTVHCQSSPREIFPHLTFQVE